MKSSVAAVLVAATGALAGSNVTYTTEIVTAITTYCPEATTLTHAGTTYTISEATTLTITDCPCTITKPVTTSTSTSCATTSTVAPVWSNGTATTLTSSSPAGTGGASVPGSPSSSPSGSATGSTPPIVTAGAGKTAALSGVGLAGFVGLAAFFL